MTNTAIDEGFYRIFNAASGTVLEVSNGAQRDGAEVQGWAAGPHDVNYFNQVWLIQKMPDDPEHYMVINVRSGKALDLDDGKRDNNTKLQVWSWSGLHQQRWWFPETEGGARWIMNAKSGTVADLADGQGGNGTRVTGWASHTGKNQKWIFRKVTIQEEGH